MYLQIYDSQNPASAHDGKQRPKASSRRGEPRRRIFRRSSAHTMFSSFNRLIRLMGIQQGHDAARSAGASSNFHRQRHNQEPRLGKLLQVRYVFQARDVGAVQNPVGNEVLLGAPEAMPTLSRQVSTTT